MKQNPTPSAKLGQWLGYSGMATAFLAIAPRSHAQVVSTDVDPDSVLINEDMDIDFDNDGIVDVNILHSASVSSSFSIGVAVVTVPNGQLLGSLVSSGSVYPSVLASGAPIAPEATNFQSSTYGVLAVKVNFGGLLYNFGQWDGQSGFMGCRFTAGDGAMHYGWVQLAVSEGVTNVTVMAYGYESTPDMPINAGDMGLTTGIADAGARTFNMSITPNPTTDRAVIALPNERTADMRVSLLNSTGQTLFTDAVGNADSYALNMADYAQGVYFVRLQDGKKVAFRKVAKQ